MATLADYPDDWEDTFLSNPNFSVVEYMRRMSEYQRLLKAQQDAADASGMSGGFEGEGSAGNVKWGGGKFSKTEYDTGDLDIVADEDLPDGVTQDAAGNRYRTDDLGNKISMGARWPGLQLARQIHNIPQVIPGYNVVKAINDSINKNKNQTTATSTDTTGTTDTNVIPQLLSTVSKTFSPAADWSLPGSTATTTGANLGITPLATAINEGGGGGIIEAMIAAGADPNDPFGDPTGFM